MFTFETLLQVLEAEGRNAPHDPNWVLSYPTVSTDSRQLQTNELFFALAGEHFNAHHFLKNVQEKNACAAVVERQFLPLVLEQNLTIPLFIVENSRHALGKLAQYWRTICSQTCVMGITGSNGKTTVKEMIAHCLQTLNVPYLATKGNLNNDIGLPLMLCQLRPEHQYAVLEMGMNHSGELTYLSQIAQPDIAVITTVQHAHFGCFDTIEAIANAKGEILSGLKANGVAILDAMSPYFFLWERLLGSKQIIPFVTEPTHFELCLLGAHNQFNARITYTILMHLGFAAETIKHALSTFAGVKRRLQTHLLQCHQTKITLIDDTYNANPDSMKAGLATLATHPSNIKIAVLGDMGELGSHAEHLHQQLGFYIADLNHIDYVFCFGSLMQHTAEGARTASHANIRVLDFNDSAEAMNVLRLTIEHLTKNNDLPQLAIFVKGSRAAKMERFVSFLSEQCASKTNL